VFKTCLKRSVSTMVLRRTSRLWSFVSRYHAQEIVWSSHLLVTEERFALGQYSFDSQLVSGSETPICNELVGVAELRLSLRSRERESLLRNLLMANSVAK
jgi:hypothetical protein